MWHQFVFSPVLLGDVEIACIYVLHVCSRVSQFTAHFGSPTGCKTHFESEKYFQFRLRSASCSICI